jgi:hypothetical protein
MCVGFALPTFRFGGWRAPWWLDDNRKPLTNPKIAGITISVSSIDETIPPMIGTAMRCMISEPVPVLHMRQGTGQHAAGIR